MNLRTFIERPVLSAVISITIVVVGIIGLFSLPVEQYPDIAPPTIMVSTTYYGASAETLQKSVIAPLEEAINGVEDMTYMTSSATNAGTEYHRVLQAGNRPGHGSGQRTEPRVESDGTASGRSNAGRCDYFQTSDKYPADVLAFQSGR